MELTIEEIEPLIEPTNQNAKAEAPTKVEAPTKAEAPLKSAMKNSQNPNPKPKQSITYDSILENMGLCVYNDTLHELSKNIEDQDQDQIQETEKTYPRINKKPRNIPQNGYIYSKFNKSYVQQQQAQQQTQAQPLQQSVQPQPPRRPMTQAAKEHQQRLIRQIVHNNMAKKQVPQNRSLMISNF